MRRCRSKRWRERRFERGEGVSAGGERSIRSEYVEQRRYSRQGEIGKGD